MSAELVREQWQAIVDEFTDAIPKYTEKMVAAQRGENFPSEERRVIEWRSMAIAMAKEIVHLRDSQKLRERRLETAVRGILALVDRDVVGDYIPSASANLHECIQELRAALEAK